jgi:hypothetical protein
MIFASIAINFFSKEPFFGVFMSMAFAFFDLDNAKKRKQIYIHPFFIVSGILSRLFGKVTKGSGKLNRRQRVREIGTALDFKLIVDTEKGQNLIQVV